MRRRLLTALAFGLALALPACSGRAPAPAPGVRALPADSAAMLERALRAARPAYDTQELALRSGVYVGIEAPREAGVPAVAAGPPPPASREAAPAARSPMAAAADAAAAARAAGPPVTAREPPAAVTDPERPPGHERVGLPPERPLGHQPVGLSPAGPVGFEYVVQIAAFRDEASAHVALGLARREYPELDVALEPGDGVHRVVLGGWSDMAAAEARLPEVRRLYPAAWARRRAVP